MDWESVQRIFDSQSSTLKDWSDAVNGVDQARQALGDACNNLANSGSAQDRAAMHDAYDKYSQEMAGTAGLVPVIPGSLGQALDLLHIDPIGSLSKALQQQVSQMPNAADTIDMLDLSQGRRMTRQDQNLCDQAREYFRHARNAPPRTDPLAIDLDGDGVETVSSSEGAMFDSDGDGLRTSTGWVSGDDGLLVMDRNGNGVIDDGTELFGSDTSLAAGGLASDGFSALADLDSNGDGVIDQADTAFSSLRVWRDFDGDGVSREAELFSLSDLGIQSISLARTTQGTVLPDENSVVSSGTVQFADGHTGTAESLGLVQDNFYNEECAPIPLSAEAAALPSMAGMGALRSLTEAATTSPDVLSVLQQYAGCQTIFEQRALLDQLVTAWAQTAPDVSAGIQYSFHLQTRYINGDPTLGDTPEYTSELQQLKVLEQFNGVALGSTSSTMVFEDQLADIQNGYEALKKGVFECLLTQTLLKPYLDAVTETDDGTAFDYSKVQALFDQRIATNASEGLLELVHFYRLMGGFVTATGWDLADFVNQRLGSFDSSDTALAGELGRYAFVLGDAAGNTLSTKDGETVFAGAGNDTISASDGGRNVIFAGDGDDIIIDGSGDDLIDGGAGNDTITDQGTGTNTLRGGDGNDTITFSFMANNTIEGDAGDDVISMDVPNAGPSSVNHTNVLAGGAGNDTLISGASADTYLFNRGDGQDSITDDGYASGETAGADKVVFGTGITSSNLQFQHSGSDLVIKVNDPNNPAATDQITVKNWNNSYYRLEQFVFSDGTALSSDDVTNLSLTGTDGADSISFWSTNGLTANGMGGDDVITDNVGVSGTIYGGDGNDTITDANGDDLIDGGAGNDTITDQGTGTNTLRGGDGNDTITFSFMANNTIEGDAGDDVISMDVPNAGPSSVNHTNVLAGGAGNDTLISGASADTYLFNRGDGQDSITDDGYASGETAGADKVVFGTGITSSNLQFQHSGSDLVIKVNDPNNPAATDQITVKNWNNSYYRLEQFVFSDGTALSSDDVTNLSLTGTDGADSISFWSTNGLTANGMGGDDVITDNVGVSGTIYGGDGNDTITDANGDDLIDGGAGNDTITDQGTGTNTLRGGDGNDTITFSFMANNTIEGDAGDDVISMDVPNAGPSSVNHTNVLAGGAGSDTLISGASADTYLFNRGDGQDSITDDGYASGETAGADQIQFGSNISYDQLWFEHVGSDLKILVIGTNDSVTVKNWYGNSEYQIETLQAGDHYMLSQSQVENLVQAMSSFAPPPQGEIVLSQTYRDAVGGALAANWVPPSPNS
jgi:Ca2+-binding RTX toxin-like protein